MGRLIMWNMMSLDGCFEGAAKSQIAWFQKRFHAAAIAYSEAQLRTAEMLLFGRITYDGMFAFWSTTTGEIADMMNGLPKIVVSRSMNSAAWHNTRVVNDDAEGCVGALKRQVSGNIFVFGSAALSVPLKNAGLFDEYRIGLTPVVLGHGTKLFGEGAKARDLRLLEARAISEGVLLLRHAPA